MAKVSTHKRVTPFNLEFDREEDGRWIAEIPRIPGVLAYGSTKREAVRKAYSIALRTLADGTSRHAIIFP